MHAAFVTRFQKLAFIILALRVVGDGGEFVQGSVDVTGVGTQWTDQLALTESVIRRAAERIPGAFATSLPHGLQRQRVQLERGVRLTTSSGASAPRLTAGSP